MPTEAEMFKKYASTHILSAGEGTPIFKLYTRHMPRDRKCFEVLRP